MVGTQKFAVCKTLLESRIEWDKELTQVLDGYRRRAWRNGVSRFEILYGVSTRMNPVNETGTSLVMY